MLIQINADVYAYYEHITPSYRVWVNDSLLNERDFWPDCLSNYIEEEIYVELEPGEHTLLLEKAKHTAGKAKFWIEKLVIKYGDTTNIETFEINPQDKQLINFKIE